MTSSDEEGEDGMNTTADVPGEGHEAPRTRPRLERPRTNRKLAGVAAAVGDHLNVDPQLVRIAFVVLTLLGGAGIALYFLGWLLIPEEGEAVSLGDSLIEWAKRSPAWAAVLIVVGTLIIVGTHGFNDGAVVWAVLLIGGGIWLYRHDSGAGTNGGGPSAAGPSGQATSGPAGGGGASVPDPGPGASGASRAEIVRTPDSLWLPSNTGSARPVARGPLVRPARRPRSYLGRYTLAAVLIILGGIALADRLGALSVAPQHYPAIALVVIGAGLLLGSIWGRSRGLILIGLMLIPAAYAGGLVNVPLRGGVNSQVFVPTTVAEAGREYRLAAGDMTIDLSHIKWGSDPVRINASVAAGEIKVVVPRNVSVDFSGHVQVGDIRFLDTDRGGIDVSYQAHTTGDGPGRLVLKTDISFGQVTVSQPGAVEAPAVPEAPSAPDAPLAPQGAQEPTGAPTPETPANPTAPSEPIAPPAP
jgi:phage shock protein PspC (stress-responsive transcriptional regulator)